MARGVGCNTACGTNGGSPVVVGFIWSDRKHRRFTAERERERETERGGGAVDFTDNGEGYKGKEERRLGGGANGTRTESVWDAARTKGRGHAY